MVTSSVIVEAQNLLEAREPFVCPLPMYGVIRSRVAAGRSIHLRHQLDVLAKDL